MSGTGKQAGEKTVQPDWYELVFEVIDMRSFSNLWYWIALAVVWSTTSHWVLGVPYDMVLRARRHAGQAQQDLEDMVRINTNRLLYILRMTGPVLLAFTCFVLTALAVTGFYYDVEFAQALFLLAFPMSIVGGLSFHTASRITHGMIRGEALQKTLSTHRIITQSIGMFSIFVTAIFGMYQNLSLGALGQ